MSCVVRTGIAGRKELTAIVYQDGAERVSLFPFLHPSVSDWAGVAASDRVLVDESEFWFLFPTITWRFLVRVYFFCRWWHLL